MSDKQKSDAAADNGAEKQPKKGGLMKVLMMAVFGIVLIGAVAFITLFIMSDEQATEENPESVETAIKAPDSTAAEPDAGVVKDYPKVDLSDLPEGLFDSSDESVLEAIVENLAMLDYQPGEDELLPEELEDMRKDSIEKATWLEKEQNRLAAWEKQLGDKQKKLEKLDREVSQKIIVIEQAESSRIASLAKLYDSMDARSVAALMANLDDDTVVSILPRMKTKNASQVLALLPAKRAAKLSKEMITIAEK